MDALYSLYRMMDSLLILKGRVTLALFEDTFIKSGLVRKRIEDLLVWWRRCHQDNILMMFYEDLKEEHSECVHRIAGFMGVDCSDEAITHVVKTTSHTEMSKHSSNLV